MNALFREGSKSCGWSEGRGALVLWPSVETGKLVNSLEYRKEKQAGFEVPGGLVKLFELASKSELILFRVLSCISRWRASVPPPPNPDPSVKALGFFCVVAL